MGARCARVKEAGLSVALRIEGKARPQPPGLDAAVYRIVQEALTNALKYAGGAPTQAVVRYAPNPVDIDVVDEGTVHARAAGIGRPPPALPHHPPLSILTAPPPRPHPPDHPR